MEQKTETMEPGSFHSFSEENDLAATATAQGDEDAIAIQMNETVKNKDDNVELENDEEDDDSEIEAKDDEDRDKFKQGKEPMSTKLFRKVCSWLMEWGTVDAMFDLFFWYTPGLSHAKATIRQGSG
jgi:hypothetical protein